MPLQVLNTPMLHTLGARLRFCLVPALLVTGIVTLSAQQTRSEIAVIDLSKSGSDETGSIKDDPSSEPDIASMTSKATYYGLIIGVNNYRDPAISSLDHAIHDAEAVYDILTDDYHFSKDHVQFLKDPARADIIYALDYLSRVVEPNDNLLIFFAGHGWWDAESNVGFWLPADARKISSEDWFRNSTLVDYLKTIKSRHTLLITDACFAGSIFKTRKAFSDAPKAIELLYEYPSRKAMTSGALTEVPDRSPFTKYFVDRLRKNRSKYLSAEQLFSSLRIAVINNSNAIPQYGEIRGVGDQGGDFIFIRE